MFDPIERTKEIAKIVCNNGMRKYYRFRYARFYGGIATADCVGCNLACKYCWAYRPRDMPQKYGRLYSPHKVASKLKRIADKYACPIRVSGNEPTLCKQHLLELLEELHDREFILETNGILIGYDNRFAKQLSQFENLYVRISLKGFDEQSFRIVTGASGFSYQIKAVKRCEKFGMNYGVAIMDFLYVLGKEKLPIQVNEIETLYVYPGIKNKVEAMMKELYRYRNRRF